MGAFDGYKYMIGYGVMYRHTCSWKESVQKSDPTYKVTCLAEGQGYYGWEVSKYFDSIEAATVEYAQIEHKFRRAELIYIDEYRRRNIVSTYKADSEYYKGFYDMYPAGVVIE